MDESPEPSQSKSPPPPQQHQQQQKKLKEKKPQTQKPVQDPNAPVKTKAELKAERRAIQEAQRAAKAAGNPAPHQQKQKQAPQQQQAKQQKQQQQPQSPSHKKNEAVKAKTSNDGMRVPSNVQMDDEKVQKRISKNLAKQNVPQRSVQQKKVALFSHLHQYEKDPFLTKDIPFSGGTIHPAIVKLGLQYAAGIISGSNARCIALLCAFKQVINDYVTPQSKELSRDLDSKIKPCISFLSQCRHLSVSMGNAIKFLKQHINQSPMDVTEKEAKERLIASIDDFINERVILAGQAISNFAKAKIHDGDKVLVYGFSSLVVNTLKDAKKSGKNFQVIVVDSRPSYSGRVTVKKLVDYDIPCSYVLINAASYIMKEVTVVFLGAHALLSNGNVMASTGSAMVAMVAKANNVPVLVCCETYKFCERVQTDSIVFNELGDPDALVRRDDSEDVLTKWREMKNLYVLNLMLDVTPSDFVDMVVTELGMIPCTSVPVVLRVKNSET